ncbi:leucyl aminopeptidase family protein [Paenibacillus sacheonensis]|uniref:Probable cytosol aminopeptidase n=1 Tax=Paenibacillus sacheonensis TaxID=742054 RepID=A0A7X4YMY5_9BACL|nr:leucyl aminopeptidase family protein [Paenibacillus sacheonensis]MBM7568768.1 leucyl aminopeptidase [Paenibacillus sacheonensis]NBC68394.1 peptidase M17 [Paenibacillus sacheonensis]
MKFEIHAETAARTLIVPVFTESLANMPSELEAIRTAKLLPYMGARHAVTWFYGANGSPDFLLMGLGDTAAFTVAVMRDAAGNAGRALYKDERSEAAVSFAALSGAGPLEESQPAFMEAWVEGSLLGTYVFDAYKSTRTERPEILVRFPVEQTAEHAEAIRLGRLRAESTMWARDLTNEPPNYLRPRDLAEQTARRFANTGVQMAVHEGEELERRGFAGLAAVGKGSLHPPVFLELQYCSDETKPLVALIGKGITFDTGGISLKRDHDISDMRMDMAGAAGVLGALDLIVRAGAAVNVVVLVPAAENSPSDRSMLPGEVIRYANGLTVQVGNTDSEGRLILADALLYAHRLGAEQVVDMATLTYSVVGALGKQIAGILGADGLVQALRQAGEPFGERVWQLPLHDEYEAYLSSDYADASNISSGDGGGAIMAALFLRKFVHPSLSWAHIDMNGPKDNAAPKGQLAAGATGWGTRLLAAYLMNGS